MGFYASEFLAVDGKCYAPTRHLTRKLDNRDDFLHTFDVIRTHAESTKGLNGFIEGECVRYFPQPAPRPFNPSLPIPFRVTHKDLALDTFREDEIHITMDRDNSHPELQQRLLEMGFFLAANRKPYGVAHIFTVQGTKQQIASLSPAIVRYLHEAGGATHCKIKQEFIQAYWVSDSNVPLPPVVDAVNWLELREPNK